jgi:uncharacterized protein (TIGR00290 family)
LFLRKRIIASAATVAKAVAVIVHMDSKKKITISWSGGKDSALALYKIMLTGTYDIHGLHTVFNAETRRVGMHGVPEVLVEKQAAMLGLPLTKLYLESSESHAAYTKLMADFYDQCRQENMEGVMFGDIFLEDLKTFREELLKPSGMEGIFPLWKKDTTVLLNDFIQRGFKTVLCSAHAKYFSSEQLGKTIDHHFIGSLSGEVDPCGENGEFHTFVYDGPVFSRPVQFTLGSVVEKKYSYRKVNPDGTAEETETVFLFQDLAL